MDADYLRDLADLCLRMLHVVAGIAWIGASFYFIRLDLGLAPPKEPKEGVAGEYWGVHGGGFYHSQKYKVAPPRLPEQLHWFKWEAYTTWLSGFALLVVLYWLDADTRLVDPTVADLSAWQAVALSAAGLALAWLIYDLACRLLIEDRLVAIAVIALVAVSAFAAGELFAARASYLQVGAMLGTIMAANVFFVIIPAHRELVRAKQEGREPNPLLGLRAKQRSVHNNYLTLPVVFTMLAGHFPLAFGSDHAWLVLLAIFAIVAAIRHFFNRWHAGKRDWWILAAAGVAAAALAVVLAPDDVDATRRAERRARQGDRDRPLLRRCHSGITAPLGVRLDEHRADAASTRTRSRRLVESGVMPPGNATGMTEAEREQLVAWAAAARIGSGRARDHRSRDALRRALGGRAGAADGRRLQGDPAARRPDHPLPLERRVELDPVGRPRPRDRPRERDQLPAPRRARALPRRRERDGAALPVRLLLVREQGGPPLGEPLRDPRRGPGAAEGARPADALGGSTADLVPRAADELRRRSREAPATRTRS